MPPGSWAVATAPGQPFAVATELPHRGKTMANGMPASKAWGLAIAAPAKQKPPGPGQGGNGGYEEKPGFQAADQGTWA